MEINIELNSKSINKAIRELRKYQKEMYNKCSLVCKRLAEEGFRVVDMTVGGHGDAGEVIKLPIEYDFEGQTATAIMSITSEPREGSNGKTFYPHLAWEFGAGIYYNNGNANPKAAEFGMGVNTFNPENGVAVDPGYWRYTGEDGVTHLSFGTQATMPMYNASIEMIKKSRAIVKEVFTSG